MVFSSYKVAERSVSQGVLSWDSSFDSRLSYVAYVVVCFSKTSKVMRCQKCQKGALRASVTFGTPSVSVFGEMHILHRPTHYARGSFSILPACVNSGIVCVNKLWTLSPDSSIISV